MVFNSLKHNLLRRMISSGVNRNLVENLSKLPIASKLGNIEELLKSTPELNNTNAHSWQSALEALKKEGFNPQNFCLMISQNPKLLTTKPEKITSSLDGWRTFQFGEKQTLHLLEKHPELINLEISREVFNRYSVIKEFLGGSNVLKLLTICPSILLQKSSILKEKIDYLQNKMKTEPVEVYKSEALSLSLEAIKTRHVFLQRLGLYVVKKKDPNEISKNPKLHQITDTSDRRFASKVCFVTPEEFEVFQEMFKKELENGNKKELDEDEFSDDEDYEIQKT